MARGKLHHLENHQILTFYVVFILLKFFEIWVKKLPSVKCNSPDFESSLSGSAFDAFEIYWTENCQNHIPSTNGQGTEEVVVAMDWND